MRIWTAALLAGATALLVAAPEAPAATPGRSPDDARYALRLRFSTEAGGTLSGTEAIRFRNTSSATMTSIWLRTWANGPAGCATPRIHVEVSAPARRGAERTACTALEIVPSKPILAGATGTLSLSFTVTVPPANDRFGRSPHGDYLLGNAIPILAVRDDRGLHITEPYFAAGESFYSLAADWRTVLRLPASLRAATTGETESERTGRGGRWLVVSARRARDFAIVVGRLREAREHIEGRTIRVWWHTRGGRRALLREAATALRTLTREAGPYRARELDVVESNFAGFGGMEYPELVMAETWPAAAVHEVAHQWWFGMVGDDEYAEPWLDESFATYSERLILGRPPTPCDVGDPLAGWSTPLDTSVAYFRRHDDRYDEVYTGGACVLYAYERAAGRSAMRSLLHLLVRRFAGGVETTDDVVRAIRATAPLGFDVDAFLLRARIR